MRAQRTLLAFRTPALGAAIAVALVVLAASHSSAQQGASRTQWWNDPGVVEEIDLTVDQRSKMDAAYERYTAEVEKNRKQRGVQREFLEALEKGDWKRGRALLDQWSERTADPHKAMGELKLEVLPLLTPEQLQKLHDNHPRLIRRQWRPAVGWSRRSGEGAEQRPFRGAKPPRGQGKQNQAPQK